VKEFSDSVGVSYTTLDNEEWCAGADEHLLSNISRSLSNQTVVLYRQIREFCSDGTEDLTCPKPSVPIDASDSPNQSEQEDECDERDVVPQPKRVRRCGKCGGAGHMRRTCKDT
jgi:hypothetical protein